MISGVFPATRGEAWRQIVRDHTIGSAVSLGEDPTFGALAWAAASIARLDQALAGHVLAPALLYRARLEAVRRHAAVDGHGINPWHLAAMLEGLRPRMDLSLSLLDRGTIFEAARYACREYRWLVLPDDDHEQRIQAAETELIAAPGATPLLAAARGLHAWIDRGGERQAGRAALIRFWGQRRLLREPFPLTGTDALRADTPWALARWIPAFLEALAKEAENGMQLLMTLERAWFTARRATAGRRRTSRAAAAVDVLAAAPLVSATSLGQALNMAVKNAAQLLDEFCADGVTVEVTHRSKRRLFGLAALAPLRDEVAPLRRPEHGRGRGRPSIHPAEEAITEPILCLPPLTPIERRTFDYSGLGAALALVDEAMSNIQRTLADGAFGVDAILAEQAGDGDPERARLAGHQLERGE
jgi:hypothetical protein